jgi:xanthine/CO dehydrogenase XdhC/CoxF family maturation factor
VEFQRAVKETRAQRHARGFTCWGQRFPEADEGVVSEFERCFERLNIDESSYVVIVTRGHLYDGIILGQALESNARYIGMIGSRKKIGTLYQSLIEKGIAKAVWVESMHPLAPTSTPKPPKRLR